MQSAAKRTGGVGCEREEESEAQPKKGRTSSAVQSPTQSSNSSQESGKPPQSEETHDGVESCAVAVATIERRTRTL